MINIFAILHYIALFHLSLSLILFINNLNILDPMQASTPTLSNSHLYSLFLTYALISPDQTIIDKELTQTLIVHSNVIKYAKCQLGDYLNLLYRHWGPKFSVQNLFDNNFISDNFYQLVMRSGLTGIFELKWCIFG